MNGLVVAEKENFLFSYNITSLTAPLRKALNRERTNVGRGAYTDRVKAILLACGNPTIADALATNLQNLERGTAHDELRWLDVQLHACRILNAHSHVVFVTSEQLLFGGSLITHAQDDGYRVVVIPFTLASKLPTLQDVEGQPVRTLEVYHDVPRKRSGSPFWCGVFGHSLVRGAEQSAKNVDFLRRTHALLAKCESAHSRCELLWSIFPAKTDGSNHFSETRKEDDE